MSNGIVEAELADAFGPRVLTYRLCGEDSLFGSGEGVQVPTPGGMWSAYGGHRMWLAPESLAETYRIDDSPPTIVRENTKAATAYHHGDARGFRTSLKVEIDAGGTGVTVTHRAVNGTDDSRTVAAWALTIVRPGGRFIVPLPVRRTHSEAMEPVSTVALWAYAAGNDPRARWLDTAIEISCDERYGEPWKIGSSGERGWCAYVHRDVAFVKRFDRIPGAAYPDRGCAVEVFTNGRFGELETLGPLVSVAPGAAIEHVERWSLLRVPPAAATEALLLEMSS